MLVKALQRNNSAWQGIEFTNQVLNAFEEGIIIVDENDTVVLCNDKFWGMGFSKDNVLGKSIVSLSVGEQQLLVTRALEYLKRGEDSKVFDRLIPAGERLIQCSYSPILDQEKHYNGMMVKLKDVTPENYFEQKNVNLHKMYNLIFKTTSDVIITIDNMGYITTINRAALEFFDLSFREAIGNKLSDIFYQGKKFNLGGEYLCLMTETLELGVEHRNKEKRILHNGKNITALMDTCLLRNEEQEVIGVLAAIRDITERKAEEEEELRKNKLKLVNQVAFGLAHEIRNPLTSVRGFIQLIHQNIRKSKRKEYLQVALDELDRANKLIKDFLLLARPAAPNFTLASFEHVIKEVVSEIKEEASLKGVSVQIIPPEEYPIMYLDKDQISCALRNVMQNAVEFTEYGQISIHIKNDIKKEKVIIEVIDSGVGLLEDDLPRIFEPFYSSKEEAPGLGLAISYRIIQNHGGEIYARNKENCGAIFTFEIPHVAFFPA